ncbi:E3 ubiquitin-protein ligase RHF1A-like isoform X2 [Macadamia integrifolia]|uniref:E3 ubiquitin-protein ligase RHF1A-like isoform X2 n=1 Tax=Macadamia integrifolia TaxID=60698 RepID=UPI001C4F32AE|nr:E3 ubiquitin-protein ligase RHF1A-like isoform X2 [Macadamia integrifolia]
MEGFTSAVENPVELPPMPPGPGADQDGYEEDACSICLEPFSSADPATVTNCRHGYHLQCILDWSQRSKECPICWQLLVLKDPASQELLAAVEIERNLRSRQRSSDTRLLVEDSQFSHDAPYSDESDFEEHIMRHLAAAGLGRPHYGRRERRRTSGMGPSQIFVFTSPANVSDVQETHTTTPTETNHMSSPDASPETILPSAIDDRPPSSPRSSRENMRSEALDHRYGHLRSGQTPPSIPQSSHSSELLSFSESIKSRWSAASAKYKESISRSTRGFREKLLARNSTVKELSRDVQREVSAGVARMMERLEPIAKRTGGSAPPSGSNEGTSGYSYNGKSVQESLIIQSQDRNDVETVHGTNSNAPFHVSESISSVPGHSEVHQAQDIL